MYSLGYGPGCCVDLAIWAMIRGLPDHKVSVGGEECLGFRLEKVLNFSK